MRTGLLKNLCLAAALFFGSSLTASAAISTTPVTTGATDAAQKLYTFLVDNYGKKTISGIMTGDNGTESTLAAQPDVKKVLELDGGVYPALIGFDYLMATGPSQNDGWFQGYTNNEIAMAKELWSKNGIPAFCWHWRCPNKKCEGFSDTIVTKGYWDFREAFTATDGTEWNTASDAYNYMVTDIDRISKLMLKLQDAGVAVLWRPLHEASGRWFWWSANCTPEQYVALYRLVYDRMVNTNGVKNCIWVWNIERTKEQCVALNDWSSPATYTTDWYPGDAYVDVIGCDVYNRGGNTSAKEFYNKIAELMGTDKLITFSETDYIPDINNMVTDNAMWSYWMPWDNSWSSMIEKTTSSVWTSNMADDRVITLEDMPAWGTYVEEVVTDPCASTDALKQEAECADYSGTVTASDDCSGGKGINCTENDNYIKFTFTVPTAGAYKVLVGNAALYGAKTFSVVVDGSSVDVSADATQEYNAGTFNFPAGEVTVTVKPGWTWFVIDYCRLELDADAAAPVVPSGLTTANASEAAQKLYGFLKENWGTKTISGFMTGSMDGVTTSSEVTAHEDFQAVYTRSGKYPALGGFDFMNATGKSSSGSWYTDYTNKAIALAKDLWNKGGIPAFTWHWRDPTYATDGFYVYDATNHADGTTFDFTTAMNADGTWNTASTEYANMITDIDKVADYFLDLQKDGIAAIFRPLHEASGAWFWWGTQGGENYAKLYRLIHDEMVNVKGVKNLVWVWNPEYATDTTWNPGSEYYDVISIDIYNSAKDYQSNYVVFNNLKKASNKSKLIALSENGPVPDVDDCFDNGATWSWWMPWYQSWSGNFADQTENTEWTKVMADERIITLDEMPGWANYTSVANASADVQVAVFPTKVKDAFFVVAATPAVASVYNMAGEVLSTVAVDGAAEISASDFAKGVYFVVVKTNGVSKTFKVVK